MARTDLRVISDELILAGKLQLKKLQKMKPEKKKIQASTGLEPVPPIIFISYLLYEY